MNILKGIYPALITPYNADGSINFDSLEKLIEKLIADQVTGFYITGSTGECFLLSFGERKELMQFIAKKTAQRVKVIAHVGSTNTTESIELAKAAETYGVDTISSVSPFYYKYSFEEIKSHYDAVMDACELPMVLYNFPALSGVTFTVENIEDLAKNKKLVAIKHTSKDLYEIEKFKRHCSDLVIFNGHDECFLGSLAMGADGAIGSTFNIMAPHFIKIQQLFSQNKMQEALELQKTVNTVIDSLIKSGVNQGIKYILEKKYGIECNNCRPPMAKITDDSKSLLDNILDLV